MTDEIHFMTDPTIMQHYPTLAFHLLNEHSFSIMGRHDYCEKAAVLGAGTMGAQIAAHLANAGIPTLLLDIVPRDPNESEARPSGGRKTPVNRQLIATASRAPDWKLRRKPSPPRSSVQSSLPWFQ